MEKMACVAHADGTRVKCEHNFSAHGGLLLCGFGHTASTCAYTILIFYCYQYYVYMTVTFLLYLLAGFQALKFQHLYFDGSTPSSSNSRYISSARGPRHCWLVYHLSRFPDSDSLQNLPSAILDQLNANAKHVPAYFLLLSPYVIILVCPIKIRSSI